MWGALSQFSNINASTCAGVTYNMAQSCDHTVGTFESPTTGLLAPYADCTCTTADRTGIHTDCTGIIWSLATVLWAPPLCYSQSVFLQPYCTHSHHSFRLSLWSIWIPLSHSSSTLDLPHPYFVLESQEQGEAIGLLREVMLWLREMVMMIFWTFPMFRPRGSVEYLILCGLTLVMFILVYLFRAQTGSIYYIFGCVSLSFPTRL